MSKLFIPVVLWSDMLLCSNVGNVEFFLDVDRIRSSEEARTLIVQGSLELMLEMEMRAFRIPFLGGARERLGRKICVAGGKIGASYAFVDNYFFCYEELAGGVVRDSYAKGKAKFYR